MLRSAVRVTFFVVLAAVALPVLLVLGLVVVYAVERGTDEGYPVVAPDVMAQRAAGRTQELYDVAGIGGELHNWRIAGVSEQEGMPALRRLRAHVEKAGWHVTGFSASGDDWVLRARRDEDDHDSERIVVTWWSHRQTLDGFTAMSCAYDPAGVGGDDAVRDLKPPTLK